LTSSRRRQETRPR